MKIINFCRKVEIVVQTYKPAARVLRMNHPMAVEPAKKYGGKPGQLLVRWSRQHEFVPLPKCVQKKKKHQRIVANAQIGGFDINCEDMAKSDSRDEYLVTGIFHGLQEVSDEITGRPIMIKLDSYRCCVISSS